MKFTGRTKFMEDAYKRYIHSDCPDIFNAYKSLSQAKVNAWEYCKKLCDEYHGSNLKVIGHNNFKFSAGFTFYWEDEKFFMYITDCSNRAMVIQ